MASLPRPIYLKGKRPGVPVDNQKLGRLAYKPQLVMRVITRWTTKNTNNSDITNNISIDENEM